MSDATELVFLELGDVLELHEQSLRDFGGGAGVRDLGMLESAIAQPRAAFGDQYAHEGLYAMAAAYLFHIASNHPFIDGNKRTALLAALVFLDVNGSPIEGGSDELYDLTMGVAEGRLEKIRVTSELERIAAASGAGGF